MINSVYSIFILVLYHKGFVQCYVLAEDDLTRFTFKKIKGDLNLDNQYKKYIYILVTIQVAIFAVITSFIIFISNNIASYNNEVFQMLVIKEKEKSMRERIDNIIVHINIQQKIALTQVEKTINLAVVRIIVFILF